MSDIVMVGAGRLATNLGAALIGGGHRLLAVYSRTRASACSLAEQWGCRALTDIGQLPQNADIYIFSVSDAALCRLINAAPLPHDALCVHTAGSMPIDVFNGKTCHAGVLYPMQTFSKERIVSFAQLPCFIEATDDRALQRLKALARSVSTKVYELNGSDRRYLHLASVFACNFANHCFAIAERICEEHGIPFDSMFPLMDETVRKARFLSPLKGQTGPAVRRDYNVMEAQLWLLESETAWAEIYRRMSCDIERMDRQKNNEE